MNKMIEITNKSKKLIRNTFSLYKEIDKIPLIITEKTIIHIYPSEDTDKKDGLIGYWDSLLFTCKFYFMPSMTFYEIKNRDGINIDISSKIQVFKDESTVIILNDYPFNINLGQAIFIYKP